MIDSGRESGKIQNAAEQSVQWICGILRGLQAFFWLRVFPALKHFPGPPASG